MALTLLVRNILFPFSAFKGRHFIYRNFAKDHSHTKRKTLICFRNVFGCVTVASSLSVFYIYGRSQKCLNTLKNGKNFERCMAKEWEVWFYCSLPLRTLSRVWGIFSDLSLPVIFRRPLLGLFSYLYSCNLDEAELERLECYETFGHFFKRRLKSDARSLQENAALVSPVDGKVLSVGKVENGVLEQIKGVSYALDAFLGSKLMTPGDESMTDFSDVEEQSMCKKKLYYCVFYLAPGDYHCFHSPTTWQVQHRKHFHGELLSVSPAIASWLQNLFILNERVVYTGKWKHGAFAYAAVGATNVGSIKVYSDETLVTNLPKRKCRLLSPLLNERNFTDFHQKTGDIFGEFNLGSTIVLIFEADDNFSFSIKPEDIVRLGQGVGYVK